MVREVVSRRALMAAAASLPVGVAGCLSDSHCEPVVDSVETVGRTEIRVYDVEAERDQRLYVSVRRYDGPRATLIVFDPDEQPLVELADVDRIERVIEITEPGRYIVMTRNDSPTDTAQWATTVAVYQGWCADVF